MQYPTNNQWERIIYSIIEKNSNPQQQNALYTYQNLCTIPELYSVIMYEFFYGMGYRFVISEHIIDKAMDSLIAIFKLIINNDNSIIDTNKDAIKLSMEKYLLDFRERYKNKLKTEHLLIV